MTAQTTGKLLGYARVSLEEIESHLENQKRQIREQGVEDRDIFTDVISGAKFDRPGLNSLREYVRDGDTVVMTTIDRLGRDMAENLNVYRELRNKKVHVKFLDLPLDSTDPMVAEILIVVLSYSAERERKMIQARILAGQARARAQGRHMGRRYPFTKDTARMMEIDLENGASGWRLHKNYGVPHSTAKRFRKRWIEGERAAEQSDDRFLARA